MMSKVLVTGGTGFIGSHLVDALVKRGEYVRCLVRKTSDVEHLKKLDVELLYGDITDRNSLEKAVKDVDVVYHLAAISKVTDRIPYGVYEKYNVGGTRNIVNACFNENIKKIINFSSIEANGALGALDKKVPIKDTAPCNPTTSYGISKYKAEQELLRVYKENGFPVTIIRPTVVYGPGDIQHGPFKLFHAINKGLFRIIGDGKNLVSWIYIGNLVHLSILAQKCKKSSGQIYFAADENPYTMNELSKTITEEERVKLSGLHIPLNFARAVSIPIESFFKNPILSKSKIRFIASSYVYDTSKIKKDLGYLDQFSLREGVRITVKWYKENGSI